MLQGMKLMHGCVGNQPVVAPPMHQLQIWRQHKICSPAGQQALKATACSTVLLYANQMLHYHSVSKEKVVAGKPPQSLSLHTVCEPRKHGFCAGMLGVYCTGQPG